MAKKAIVELELQTDSYKASLVEIQKGNTTISESASKAAQTAQAAFTETGKAAKAAFASTEVKKALTDQTAGIDKLAASLQKLIQEQVDLLAAGKKQSDEFKKNQAEIARVNGEIAKLTKQTEQLATAEDKTTKKSQSLTAQLRAMKLELSLLEQEGKDGTAQFQNLAIAAGRLEDQIGDTRERVRVLASDTFVFDAAVDSVNALAGGFAVAQGAVGLFAEDSESLQRAIAKTNSALAILNGLQQINAFVTGQSAGKLAILNILQKVNDQSVKQSAISYNILGRSVQFTAVQLNVLKGAFAAIGIGLVVFAITELIEAFEKLSEKNKKYESSVKGTNQAIKESGEALKALNEIIKEAETSINVSTGKITKSQADLNAEIDRVREKSKEAYAPLISQQLDLQESLRNVNAEINKQNQIIEGNRGSKREGAALTLRNAQKALNEELEKRTKIEQELAKLDARRQEISSKTVAAIQAVTRATKESENEEARKKALEAAQKQAQLERDVAKASREIALKLEKENAEFSIAIRTKLESDYQKELDRLREIKRQRDEARVKSFETINEDFYEGQINRLKTLEAEEGSSSERRIQIIQLEARRRIAEIRLTAENTAAGTAKVNNQIMLIEAEAQAAIRAERKQTFEQSVNLAFEYADQFASILRSLNDLSRQNTENQIADIQRRQAVELEAINNTLGTERQKQRERAALELRTNRAITEEKRKQAKQDKALAIFEATINTASSIVKTGANLGYPAAIPFQVAAGIVGAAQIAAIAARPIPRFEKGGKVGGKRHSQGGTLIEAEVDEFVTRRGQSIRHRSELEAINRSTAEYHRLIQRNYVRPAIARVLADRKQDKPTFNLNATLNSKKMEGELKGLRKDIRRSKQRNYTNQTDSRYQWRNN